MTDATGQPLSLDADVLEGTSDGLHITYQTDDGQTVTTLASSTDAADIVSKAFTTVADGTEQNVEYITMTPEEAAAAGVVAAPEDEQQVVTTSLQFDPANPSVLYTADGTPINQADLTPEEQALVQAALQQHLAEQEAEQALAMMQTENTEQQVEGSSPQETAGAEGSAETSILHQAAGAAPDQVDATVTSTGAGFGEMMDGVNLASATTSASQIVQSLADSVRKQQLQDRMQQNNDAMSLPKSTLRGVDGSAGGGMKYEEKIVIRQGQPQVVKVPVKRKPEIPAALANLMPKVEIGKDGSQVIRIHQSQITPDQLKALQDNPNVRLVFRPAGSTRYPTKMVPTNAPKKRGRPRKVDEARVDASEPVEPELDDPPAKTRCGRLSKRPIYTKDYLTPKIAPGMDDVDIEQMLDPGDQAFTPKSTSPQSPKKPRGRPPGKSYNKRSGSYASKIEALRNQDNSDSPLHAVASSKPTLTPIEMAISTRRKNRLREMLSACSQDEIMEVAMPHLARVFSLWEFLITKVEKNKMARVFFADVYKEYECLHKYVSKLAEKYKKAIESEKATPETSEGVREGEEGKQEKEGAEEVEEMTEEGKQQSKLTTVTCKQLALSLGIDTETLTDAEVPLIDPEEAVGPRLMGLPPTGGRRGNQGKYIEDKIIRKPKAFTSGTDTDIKGHIVQETNEAKPVHAEATSTMPQISSTKNAAMPPLKPLGQTPKSTKMDAVVQNAAVTPVNGATNAQEQQVVSGAIEQMETTPATEAVSAEVVAEASAEGSGTQLIQIGQGEDQQFIEVPEGYTLIQTREGLVMSQPGTTISQGEDGVIYVTHADGTTTPLNAAQQEGVPMETVESLLSLDGQQPQA